jgi:hypothetical protein
MTQPDLTVGGAPTVPPPTRAPSVPDSPGRPDRPDHADGPVRADRPVHRLTRQRAFMVVAPIRCSQLETLRGILDRMVHPPERPGEPKLKIENNPTLPFARLEEIHFARLVIVERSLSAKRSSPTEPEMRDVGPWLVFSTNYDGTLAEHLGNLMTQAGPGIDELFRNCEGWPGPDSRLDAIRYLEAHAVPYEAFYVGFPGASVRQIKMEAELRDEIGRFLDGHPTLRRSCRQNPGRVRAEIIQHLNSGPFAWATRPVERPLVSLQPLKVVAWWILALAAALILLALSPIWIPILLYKEMRDPELGSLQYDKELLQLADTEDKIVQNQMTILVDVKSGLFRRGVLRTFLGVIDFLARVVYNKGKLGSIPSIHFARWVLLDEGRALLFCSNYSGSWESYLGDFIDKAAKGLTGVWSNTVLFPRTLGLVWKGARDERRFKVWARAQQMQTNVWYSAYQNLSAVNILNNRALRDGLTHPLNGKELSRWVQRL